jgi:hypothetical protein
MSRPAFLKQIREMIDTAKPGTVFIPKDFAGITDAAKISVSLNRLKDNGELTCLGRGLFMKPRFSTLLNKSVPPRADDVAKALARKYGWTIIPCGDTAMNALGLSTQVPAVWAYVSDGPYREYEMDGVKLRFKHTDKNSEITGLSYETALVIQAIKALGKDDIAPQNLRKLAGKLNRKTKDQMLIEAQQATAWVYECIKRICAEESK